MISELFAFFTGWTIFAPDMKLLSLSICLLLSCSLLAQGHDAWINKINTVADAHKYASKHKDVVVDIVNPELDVFLFEEVDLLKMDQYIGQIRTLYNRKTKFLKDTLVTMTDLHFLAVVSKDKVKIDSLLRCLQKELDNGETFWNLMRRYQYKSEDLHFSSGPIRADIAEKRYGVSLKEALPGQVFQVSKNQDCGFLIVDKQVHQVPAFIAISYNSNLNE